ncbi:hypothetical protein, partial [Vibrio sp. V28_P6S34P95]|uniref:hypothetical protein n=1 Tax=Vibrio sp. V28_P6S34P95 TaxID=1938680 RepID=UPI001F32094B
NKTRTAVLYFSDFDMTLVKTTKAELITKGATPTTDIVVCCFRLLCHSPITAYLSKIEKKT